MKAISKIIFALLAVVCCAVAFIGIYAMHILHGGKQPSGMHTSVLTDINAVADPRKVFPNVHRMNILCMGIDDNWTDSDVVFTHNARTDTLFMLSLDFDKQKACMLSIPRDSYVPIAGTEKKDKINAAYATGGPARCEYTVRDLLGVMPDHYILLNIDATKHMVDALGGVDVNVEHAMDYDDNWGHLHVHLRPGLQHLNGDQAVAFARFRHPNHGTTYEDGDERRIYRQHVLMRAMIDEIKQWQSWDKIGFLVNTALENVRTDMSRDQLLALANIFKTVSQEDITAASLTGQDSMAGNASVFLLDDNTPLYVRWLLQGDDSAERELTAVIIKNGTSNSQLMTTAFDTLSSVGYHVVQEPSSVSVAQTSVIDSGVPDLHGAAQIAACLGLPNAPVVRKPVQTNHRGWARPPTVTVMLGSDFATARQ